MFPSARSEERFSPVISLFIFFPPRPISFLRPFKPLSINLLLFCQFVSVLLTVTIILQMSAIIVSFIPSVRFRPRSVKNIEERKEAYPRMFFLSLSLSLLFHYSLLRLGSFWFVHPGGTCINIWWFEKCNKEAKSAELFSSGSCIELTQLVLTFPWRLWTVTWQRWNISHLFFKWKEWKTLIVMSHAVMRGGKLHFITLSTPCGKLHFT